jgi:hypothetical protein
VEITLGRKEKKLHLCSPQVRKEKGIEKREKANEKNKK